MQTQKTQRGDAGLQFEFHFLYLLYNLGAQSIQKAFLSGYRVYCDIVGNMKPQRGGLTVRIKHVPKHAKSLGDALNAAEAQGLQEGGGK